jgi:hypothetical protein
MRMEEGGKGREGKGREGKGVEEGCKCGEHGCETSSLICLSAIVQ